MNWTLGYMGKGDQSTRGELPEDAIKPDFSNFSQKIKTAIKQRSRPYIFGHRENLDDLANNLRELAISLNRKNSRNLSIVENRLNSIPSNIDEDKSQLISADLTENDVKEKNIQAVLHLRTLLMELGIYDSFVKTDINSENGAPNIDKLDNSLSEFEINSLVQNALNPLFARTELSADQKIEIVSASSKIFKACIDSNNGLANGDDKVSSFDANVVTVALPSEAPATWKADKLAGDTPPEFIKRVYGEWLGKGLDRPTVRRLDPSLGQALDNWLRKNDMPPDVDLPTAKERNAREIEHLRAASGTGDIKDVLGSFTLREAQRIEANIRRHKQSQR